MNRKKILWIIAGVAGLFLITLPAQLKPWTYPSDDSYFYLQIASNIASGHGSTFNNITPTNGYHPLWMEICTAIARIASGNRMFQLRLTLAFQVLIFVMILISFIQVAKLLKIKNYLLPVPLLAVYFLAIGNYASEAHLNALLMLICFYYILVNTGKWNWAKSLLIGIYLGLLFLARLDNIFVIGILILYMIIKGRAGRLALLTIGLTSAVTVSYFLYNLYTFGNIVTISAAIKSSFPGIAFDYNSLGTLGMILTFWAGITLLAINFPGFRLESRGFLSYLAVGTLMHAHFIAFFSDHLTNWAWYYVLGFVYFSLTFATIGDFWQKKRFFPKFAAGGLIVLLSFLAISRSWSEYFNPDARGFNPFQFSSANSCRWQVETAKILKQKLPPGTEILIYDWPGMIAYFSGMDILPIDGLVNDFDYQKRILEVGISAYLKENGIKYFLGPDFVYPQRIIGYENFEKINGLSEFKVYSSLYGRPAGTFFVHDSSVVLRFRDHVKCSSMPNLALWRLDRLE